MPSFGRAPTRTVIHALAPFALISIASVSSARTASSQRTSVASASAARDSCRPDPDGPRVSRAAFAASEQSAYVLPYLPGAPRLAWRTTSHFNPGNKGVGLYAIDFEMPIGTPVIAVRAGTVVAARDTFPDGNDKDLEENFVMVRHADSTVARYIHLTQRGALVRVGDVVREGQRIALSGNTGQTGGPHLHFDVQRCGPNLPPGYNTLPCGMTVPLTFRNAGPNVCGLVPGRRYRATAVTRP
jgi:murein DD-endopeptidase MepM/ murein hydrolase activator NlpD